MQNIYSAVDYCLEWLYNSKSPSSIDFANFKGHWNPTCLKKNYSLSIINDINYLDKNPVRDWVVQSLGNHHNEIALVLEPYELSKILTQYPRDQKLLITNFNNALAINLENLKIVNPDGNTNQYADLATLSTAVYATLNNGLQIYPINFKHQLNFDFLLSENHNNRIDQFGNNSAHFILAQNYPAAEKFLDIIKNLDAKYLIAPNSVGLTPIDVCQDLKLKIWLVENLGSKIAAADLDNLATVFYALDFEPEEINHKKSALTVALNKQLVQHVIFTGEALDATNQDFLDFVLVKLSNYNNLISLDVSQVVLDDSYEHIIDKIIENNPRVNLIREKNLEITKLGLKP